MQLKTLTRCLLLVALLGALLTPAAHTHIVRAARENAPRAEVTAFDLIVAMNTLRMSNGLPALIEDPIINAVAQNTAATMAANQMSWHIGDVRGRLAAAGYGGGATVWGTENFAVATNATIDQIMLMWADDSHMIPAVNPAYCHVGAGTAVAPSGATYYVLQAAYTSSKACGEYRAPGGATLVPQGSTNPLNLGVSQLIVPVKIAKPDADGKIYHEVQAGQSFWAIAVAYKTTIEVLETWNNISRKTPLRVGQKLFIPDNNTAGYFTPTPAGMIQLAKPDKDGRVVHTVALYNTLTTISQAYGVAVDTIIRLNNWNAEWPLQIGQKLVINAGNITPSATPRPLTPIEKLTPDADGKYYHVVGSGETLTWIANLYTVDINALMSWNGLNSASILRPNQKLLLQVTPPAPPTATPGPPTITPSITPLPPTLTATHTLAPATSTATPVPAPTDNPALIWSVLAGAAAFGLVLIVVFSRKR